MNNNKRKCETEKNSSHIKRKRTLLYRIYTRGQSFNESLATIQELYQFNLLDKNVLFINKSNTCETDNRFLPILLTSDYKDIVHSDYVFKDISFFSRDSEIRGNFLPIGQYYNLISFCDLELENKTLSLLLDLKNKTIEAMNQQLDHNIWIDLKNEKVNLLMFYRLLNMKSEILFSGSWLNFNEMYQKVKCSNELAELLVQAKTSITNGNNFSINNFIPLIEEQALFIDHRPSRSSDVLSFFYNNIVGDYDMF